MKSNSIKIALLGTAFAVAAGAAHADALSTPAMSGPLTANASPTSFDSGMGTVYVTGTVSGLAMAQSDRVIASGGNHSTLLDFSNAEVSIQKTDGLVQFFVQAGEYSLPTVGVPYQRAATATANNFGIVPVAYLKIAPSSSFSIEAGKLPTLIGAEYTFTFENLDIERGLLWNEEPAISRGIQANYTIGPVALSLSWNDGAYTDKMTDLSGEAAWTISSSDSLEFAASGDLSSPKVIVNPPYPNESLYVANESVYNLIWTHTSGPWTITPYVQLTDVPSFHVGKTLIPDTSTWGGAVLANYAFDSNWSLGGRVEYMAQNNGTDPAFYGAGSKAWTFTITPTYQYKLLFVRADASLVSLSDYATGSGFGTKGTSGGQIRGLIEAGIIF